MTRLRTAVFCFALVVGSAAFVPSTASAQEPGAVAPAATWPEADPEDVASIDAVIAALYDVISGPAGEARDWDRFRSLMIPQARLIPTGRGQDGAIRHNVSTTEDYIRQSGAFLEERGFFESEIGRTTERFGQIAHAFSTYESRWTLEDEEPFDRGINSIQLLHDGERWWILNVFWAAESSGLEIPERYLGGGPS